jgi:hypothetical protein
MAKTTTIKNININYYHVHFKNFIYNEICHDEADYRYLTSLFGSELSSDLSDILAYCLMPNSFQLLIKCNNEKCVIDAINKILISYGQYYSAKYDTEMIVDDNYSISPVISFDELLEASRQIHIAHNNWLHYPHSSLRAYLYDDAPDFIDRSCIANIYGSAVEYFNFLSE